MKIQRAKREEHPVRVDYAKIKKLISIVERNDLTELAVEEDGLAVTIKREQVKNPGSPPQAAPVVEIQTAAVESPQHEVAEEIRYEHLAEIVSPMVGIFYRRPSTDSPQFIEVGDEIEVGQTIGLIEAMKVFSEVPAEVAGRVTAILAGNAKLVQAGDVLVVVDTSATSR